MLNKYSNDSWSSNDNKDREIGFKFLKILCIYLKYTA